MCCKGKCAKGLGVSVVACDALGFVDGVIGCFGVGVVEAFGVLVDEDLFGFHPDCGP